MGVGGGVPAPEAIPASVVGIVSVEAFGDVCVVVAVTLEPVGEPVVVVVVVGLPRVAVTLACVEVVVTLGASYG